MPIVHGGKRRCGNTKVSTGYPRSRAHSGQQRASPCPVFHTDSPPCCLGRAGTDTIRLTDPPCAGAHRQCGGQKPSHSGQRLRVREIWPQTPQLVLPGGESVTIPGVLSSLCKDMGSWWRKCPSGGECPRLLISRGLLSKPRLRDGVAACFLVSNAAPPLPLSLLPMPLPNLHKIDGNSPNAQCEWISSGPWSRS